MKNSSFYQLYSQSCCYVLLFSLLCTADNDMLLTFLSGLQVSFINENDENGLKSTIENLNDLANFLL